jgi:hypothetical protein
MNLPDLPEQHRKKEADFGVALRAFLKAHPRETCAIELKQTKTDSLPFSAVEDRQIAYGEAISGDKGVLMRVEGVNGEPDYVYLRGEPAFICIRYPKQFSFITVGTFKLERSRSKRKSLIYSRAKEISILTVPMKCTVSR